MAKGRWADLRPADPLIWQHTPPTDRSAGTADFKEIPSDGVLFGCFVAQVASGVTVREGECWAGVGVSREPDSSLAVDVLGVLFADYLQEGHGASESFIFPVAGHTYAYLAAYNAITGVEVQATVNWMRWD